MASDRERRLVESAPSDSRAWSNTSATGPIGIIRVGEAAGGPDPVTGAEPLATAATMAGGGGLPRNRAMAKSPFEFASPAVTIFPSDWIARSLA